MDQPTTGPLLAERLARAIALGGPIPISQFMAAANTHYYATRDPLGADGDFTTAPEISQMFGELIGAWAADLWERAGQPPAAWVELGPGRGTLSADALRVMAHAGFNPPVHFVETSATMRAAQGQRVPGATWHDSITTLPEDVPLIVVANEFFDALPIRQLVKRGETWHERLVACQDTLFLPIAGTSVPDTIIPPALASAASGVIVETSPASVAIMADLSARIVAQGGAALVIDYGYDGPAVGDTLQAVRGHAYANPFEAPGEQDLTAHVDLATLRLVASASGAATFGTTAQGAFLRALGIDQRAAALGERVAGDRRRLVDDMGELFKVIALTHPHWPQPAGFGA
ncbi:SAM-dependent MidA family methyltransferase [Sphingomonas endophytica]|uniref:SAM-dependent MidA family methyltransferase n=1 Tax=Sphingomonas endophytica TaxID=869719 RepID=A0A7X0MQJ4_9SPHN|nr:SAM-dependent methyltransferase [Sphingomonas endophytica]MBB6505563.1 SAM-dependent MidA family methyltransferase [Sphingomonas endophytica]